MDFCDVAILGAGPFGLSAAAHLQNVKGLDLRLFGRPMQFWEQCMPPRMLLRSHWQATHIDDPGDELSLDAFVSNTGRTGLGEPIPATEFIRYGQWFHDTAGLDADPRGVELIEVSGNGYELTLSDGASLRAKRVIVAAGIEPFAYKPEIFRDVPAQLVSHSSELRDYSAFRHKKVLVIGGGQSALESAAFLKQGGANVEILVREPSQCKGKSRLRTMIPAAWLKPLHGRGGVGPAGISLIIQRPSLFGRLPRKTQAIWGRRATKLGFSYRLVPDMNGTPVFSGLAVERVRVEGERLGLHLTDGGERQVDHVVLGTGYRVNIGQYRFLSRGILERLDIVDGYPRLDSGLESSLPGLHFTGAVAAYSFGPLMRFVAGTPFASAAVARRVRRAHPKELRLEARPRKTEEPLAEFGNSSRPSVWDQHAER